jgi:hypothetical protein
VAWLVGACVTWLGACVIWLGKWATLLGVRRMWGMVRMKVAVKLCVQSRQVDDDWPATLGGCLGRQANTCAWCMETVFGVGAGVMENDQPIERGVHDVDLRHREYFATLHA